MGLRKGGMSVTGRLRELSYLGMVDATNIMNILKLENIHSFMQKKMS